MLTLLTTFLYAQVPADQEVIVIEGGVENIGLLEKTINEDVLDNGNRINPNRVYMLKANTVYFMESRIQFGGPDIEETSATLTIVGEEVEGGKKPIVLSSPRDGGNAFTHVVHGSLTLKNLYWPARTVSNRGATLFSILRDRQTLRMEDVVTEFALSGDLISMRQVDGPANIFLKDCYFRDNSQFENSFNFAVIARGDNGEPIDTLSVQNCTVANSGLTFFGKNNPINFLFFDHNSIINTPKYVFFFEQYKEAYFTNNLFVNCNWEGECQSTQETQLQSQIAEAATGGHPVGITNVMEIDPMLWELGHGFVPEMEDVIWLSSNNIHFTSPFLDKYYNGEFNDVGDFPLSYRAWSADISDEDLPIPVTNVAPAFISNYAQAIINEYEGIIAEGNYDNTINPEVATKSIPNQEIGDEFARMARRNYGVPDPGDFDKLSIAFGDLDPTTIPGVETENGDGITQISDFIEDFSYAADVRSEIDGMPMGALTWWSDMEYDADGALATVQEYYNNLLNGGGVDPTEILADFNGSFENDFDFWRFYEVPNAIGSVAEIVTDPEHVIDGEKAARITYVEPTDDLVDRSLDSWDSNTPLQPNTEYFGSFWAKKDAASPEGSIQTTYGLFDAERNVVGESGEGFPLTNEYQQFEFSFTTNENTDRGWLAFRWKTADNSAFLPGIIYIDHVRLSTDRALVPVKNVSADNLIAQLKEVYPNPFNDVTTINYNLVEAANVQVVIYNSYGQQVAELLNGKVPAGEHQLTWDAQHLPNGIYTVGLKTGDTLSAKRVILLK